MENLYIYMKKLPKPCRKGWIINNTGNLYIQLYKSNTKLIEEQMFGRGKLFIGSNECNSAHSA
jgi:hypothetical protein